MLPAFPQLTYEPNPQRIVDVLNSDQIASPKSVGGRPIKVRARNALDDIGVRFDHCDSPIDVMCRSANGCELDINFEEITFSVNVSAPQACRQSTILGDRKSVV